MIVCGCNNLIKPSAETYAHTQVIDGFAVIVMFDCSVCRSTRGHLIWESVDDAEEPIAAE